MKVLRLLVLCVVMLGSYSLAQGVLSPEDLLEDIDQFQEALEGRFSYLEANNFDYQTALDDLRQQASEGMTQREFGIALIRFMANFIDGHAGVGLRSDSELFLPFLVEPVGERYVAFLEDRTQFLEPDYPYLVAIDGMDMDAWVEATSVYYAEGSEQFKTWEALRWLRDIQFLRAEFGMPVLDTLSVRLANEQGDVLETTLTLSDDSPSYGTWFDMESQVLFPNIGYLRIDDMDERAVTEIQRLMPSFADTNGLIIDVRDNTGGSRDALLELFPYFMTPEDTPHIANVAKYRLSEYFDDDHLEARFMYRQTFYAPDSAEFAAIEAFQQTFEPQWQPPEDKFSEWHYLILSKAEDDTRYFYDKPVVILTNPKVFSATDIFVAAFKGWRNVTIMGQPTSGGSARTQGFELDNSNLGIGMGSMASFQPSGLLYDGNGVQPDILVDPVPTDFVTGQADSVLDAAIEFILESR